MANLQAERVKEANKVKAAKEAALKSKVVEKEPEEEYNQDHLVMVMCSILAADKTKLLDIPSVVMKAKQVLNAAK